MEQVQGPVAAERRGTKRSFLPEFADERNKAFDQEIQVRDAREPRL
jgi:hypothetical protein